MLFYSTVKPLPPGFELRRLSVYDLVESRVKPVTVYTNDRESIFTLLGDKLALFQGVIIQPGVEFTVEPHSETLWLVSSPASTLPLLRDICAPLMTLLSQTTTLKHKQQEQELALVRTSRDLEVTRGDYKKVTARLQGQVKEITTVQEQITASQNRLVQIINLMPQLIFATDTDNKILLCNQALAEQYRSRPNKLLGKTERNLGAPQTWTDACTTADREVFKTRCHTDINELSRYHHDGNCHYYQLTKIPFVISGSSDPAVLTIATDITARRNAEKAIMDLNDVLEQRVEDRTLKLEEANRQLLLSKDNAEQANHAKSLFLANMSHEIRTPMNGVIGLLELVQQTLLNDEQQNMIVTAQDSATSLLNILNDILDLSKIEAGHLELESIPLCLEEVVESVAETLAPTARKKDLRLYCEVDPNISQYLIGDRTRLRQILFNLCGNAIKFTSSEHKTGQVLLLAKLIREDISSVTICLQIQDNGVGMNERVLQTLFTPFSQAETSTTRRYGGTGLGLSICKQLVDLMSGDISVQSTPNLGTEFRVLLTLPIDKAKAGKTRGDHNLNDICVINTVTDAKTTHLLTFYLEAAGATVINPTLIDPEQPQKHQHSATTLLLCEAVVGEDLENQINAKRQQHNPPDLPVVVLVPRRETHLSARIPNMALVLNHPIRRKQLLAAIESIATRVCPQINTTNQTPIPTSRHTDKHILVAEDNPTNQLVIQKQLEKLGYQVTMVENGALALDYWRNHAVDLVLTDCHMPEMDGFQLTASIRNEETKPHRIPIIAITANALKGEADRCLVADMDDYLAKPVSLKSLGKKIDKWLTEQPYTL